MRQNIYTFRFVWFFGYLFLLTYELLLKNPWTILGSSVAQNPPLDTHSAPASAFLHISSFFVLGWLACFALIEESEKDKIRYSLWLVAYSGITEVLQTWVPGRWPSGEDVLFNVLGLILGAFIFYRCLRGWRILNPLWASTASY